MSTIRFYSSSASSGSAHKSSDKAAAVATAKFWKKLKGMNKRDASLLFPPPILTKKEADTILLGEDSTVKDSAVLLAAADQKEKIKTAGEVKDKEVIGDGDIDGDQLVITDDSGSTFFGEFVGAALGDAQGGALVYKLMEGSAVTFACVEIVKGVYKSGKKATETYVQNKGIKIHLLSPTETLIEFDMKGVKEGTVNAWVDGHNMLHVSGLELKNEKFSFMKREYHLPHAYVSIQATHYTLLKCVVVSVVNAAGNTKADVVTDETIGDAESNKNA